MEGAQLLIVLSLGSIFLGGLLGVCLIIYRAWRRLQAHATRNMELDADTLRILEALGADSGKRPKPAPKKASDTNSDPDYRV